MTKFLSLLIAFVALIASVFLIFGCVVESNKGNTVNSNYGQLAEQSAAYRRESLNLRDTIATLETKKASLEKSLIARKEEAVYRNNATALLTFNDGFTATTQDILNILNEKDVKATFFMTGTQTSTEAGVAALKAAVAGGHRIGIQSYSGKYAEIYASEDAYFQDLYRCRDLIKQLTDVDAVVVRMPGGTSTAKTRLGQAAYDRVIDRLSEEGFVLDDWHIDAHDTTEKNASAIVKRLLAFSEGVLDDNDKSCLFLFSNTARTVSALPEIIDGLKEQGYVFASLPETFSIYTMVK